MKTLVPLPYLQLFLGAWLTLFSASALAAEKDSSERRALWILSAEAGVGPIEEDFFLHLTPRLSFLTPTGALFCEGQNCETFFEVALQAPLRLRIVDREPLQEDLLRREDWLEVSDYFRVLRRMEYGSPSTPLHLRLGELGPANLGNATVLNGYHNVITTDHYLLGFQGRLRQDAFSVELLANNLVAPNILAIRGELQLPFLYDSQSSWKKFTLGASAITDLKAPRDLEADNEGITQAGPNLRPRVAEEEATLIASLDLRWHLVRKPAWTFTPYADLNHHLQLGTGLHAGFFFSRNIENVAELSSRLEYRLLTGRYLPDYIDPIYEITRYQYLSAAQPNQAAPKLSIAQSLPSQIRHGGFGQIQARFLNLLVLSLAYADAEGASNADLRLRAALEFNDTARIGLFYYKFASSSEEGHGPRLRELFHPNGALVALEARQVLWGPIYTHGHYGQQWTLRDDGAFENLHLWNVGVGAAYSF